MHFSTFFALLAVGVLSFPFESKSPSRSFIPKERDDTFLSGILVGTPGSKHQVAISTASLNTFLTSVDFKRGPANRTPYDPRNSSTSRHMRSYAVNENDVDIYGKLYEDVIYFTYIKITQYFGVADVMAGQDRMAVDGQLGFAWIPYAETKPSPNNSIIHSLLANQNEKVFHLHTPYGAPHVRLGGESYCPGTPLFHPILKDKPLPMITVTDFELGDYHSAVGYPALIDSSSPVLRFPRAIYSAIIKEYGAYYDNRLDRMVVRCNVKSHVWKFTINKKTTLQLTHKQMVVGIKNSPRCGLMVEKNTYEEDVFTLGNPILLNYCVSFHVAKNQIAILAAPED